MAIRAHQCIRIGDFIAVLISITPNGLGQIFKVYLMTNPGSGGNDAEIVKRILTPFQKGITLHIAFIFAIYVHLEGAGIAKFVNHHRMVDDQINWVQRVNFFCIAAQSHQSIAHRSQIYNGRNAGEILHQNAGRAIGDFARVLATIRAPYRKGFDILERYGFAILEAQHVFQHNF